MLSKIINNETKQVELGYKEYENFYLENGFSEQDVEQAYDGSWYLLGFAPIAPEPSYAELRAGAYPEMIEQIDMLYHDIDNGLLGEPAKQSSFYLARKSVKDEFPKPEDNVE